MVDITVPPADWLTKRLRPLTRISAFDLDGLAGGMGEVAAARGDEHDLLVRDPAERGLGPGKSAPVAPSREAVTCWCIALASAAAPQ